jgi:starch synthase
VVRATGGLADTVRDDDGHGGDGTGFVFTPYEASAMLDAMRRARHAYADPARWRALMVRGMRQDFSWKRSARQFIEVYEQAAERASRRAAA